MKKLTLWVAPHLQGAHYDIVTRLKRECVEQRDKAQWYDDEVGMNTYGPVTKVTILYRDAFDLATGLLSGAAYSSQRPSMWGGRSD